MDFERLRRASQGRGVVVIAKEVTTRHVLNNLITRQNYAQNKGGTGNAGTDPTTDLDQFIYGLTSMDSQHIVG